jgi:hypothetical protein
VAAIGVAQEFQNVFLGTRTLRQRTDTGVPVYSFGKADRRVTVYYF